MIQLALVVAAGSLASGLMLAPVVACCDSMAVLLKKAKSW